VAIPAAQPEPAQVQQPGWIKGAKAVAAREAGRRVTPQSPSYCCAIVPDSREVDVISSGFRSTDFDLSA